VRLAFLSGIETQVDRSRHLIDVLPAGALGADGLEVDFFGGDLGVVGNG
jgi:hypothetical protein